jgi:hypothetical protein
MAFKENLGYILLGFIALVSIFLVVLALLEKKLHIRFLRGRYARNEFYIEKIASIKINNPNENLKELSNVSIDFFREAFHVKGNLDFSQLASYFNEKNNRKATQFCSEIVRYMYSKESITIERLQFLIQLLAEIVSSNKIITKEQKKELDQKSRKNTSILGKINIPGIIKKKSQNK